jgi:O-acetyl-ADP-ribose deacetylase (regulator of RNase III)
VIKYVTGNLLESEAKVLVNTVNCEGYMGKGIAYQFKLAFPENNRSYVAACKSGRLKIGTLHHFVENGKIIVNFPTKNKWRANSKMEYIEKGLDELINLLNKLNAPSVAIPPLGSGNGGLIWADVKNLIEEKLSPVSENVEILIYEPSMNYTALPAAEPKLSTSALILMQIKMSLTKFSTLRLQKTAYIMDIFSVKPYFNFKKDKLGPYDHSIGVISKSINEFQKYHNTKNTDEAYNIALSKLISEKTSSHLNILLPLVKKASDYVNLISEDKTLECLTTILFILKTNGDLEEEQIFFNFKNWSEDKAKRFTEQEIKQGLEYLHNTCMVERTLMGYRSINSWN